MAVLPVKNRKFYMSAPNVPEGEMKRERMFIFKEIIAIFISKWAGAVGVDRFFGNGMDEMQSAGVQHQAWCLFAAWGQKSAVQIAAQNRVAESLAVNA